MGNYQQPAGYGGQDGWDPNLADLNKIRMVDPEGYREIMEKRMKAQSKREDARVDAFYKIDDVFSSFTLSNYLDDEYITKVYVPGSVRAIRPDVTIWDMKGFLHAMVKKNEATFKELDQEEWKLTEKLMNVQAGLDRYSGHLDPKYKAIAQEIDKVRRVKDDKRENLRRLFAFIKAFDDATLDDGPLESLVEHCSYCVLRMEERKRERGEH